MFGSQTGSGARTFRTWAAAAAVLAMTLAAYTSSGSAYAGGTASSFVPGKDASYATNPCPDPNLQPPGPVPTPSPYAALNLPEGTVCGLLTVPENRSDPNGRKIKIGVAEVKAESPNPPSDPIVYLTGGPGGSGILVANGYLKAGINRDRNVIFVDQRGEYHADPALTCPEIDNFIAAQASLSVQAPTTQTKDLAAVKACRSRLAGLGVDLSAYDTPENAADIADLRVAMHIKTWNVYGVSYGSDLALQLLRSYPQGIRSVVLGSVVPPQVNLIKQWWPSAAQGYRALFDACAAERACKQAYPRLSADLTTAVKTLAAHPLTVQVREADGSTHTVVVDGYSLANLVVVASLSGTYAGLPGWIHAAATGNGMPVTEAVLQAATGQLPGVAAYGLSYGVFCRESVAHTTRAQVLATARRALPNFPNSVLRLVPQAPRMFPECGTWNVGRAVPSTLVPTRSSVPTLLLDGSLDAVTPPSEAYAAARTLTRSTVIVLTGLGHDTLGHSPCAATIMNAFIDQPTSTVSTTCAKALTEPTFTTGT